MAQQRINDFCAGAEKQAAYDAKRISEDLVFFMNCTEETFRKKFKNVHKGDLTYVDQPYDEGQLCFDAELFAKLYNWKVEEYKIQDHNPGAPAYDYQRIGDPDQADNGGKEIYLKMSKNGHTVEIHSDNGHLLSQGKFIVDGKEGTGCAYAEDGRLFIEDDLYDEFIRMGGDKDFNYISPSITTPASSLEAVGGL